jgi:SOS-response transcriptional repressor LexA
MTLKQRDVLRWIKEFWSTHQYSPSFREIAKGIGAKSTSSVSSIVTKLIRDGWLENHPHGHRTVVPTNKAV